MDKQVSPVHGERRVALVELVNRVLDRGVVVSGEITISVAEVDLLYLGVRLLLSSIDPVVPERGSAGRASPVDARAP